MKYAAETDPALTEITALFTEKNGVAPEGITALPAAGSNRRYYRLAGGDQTAIGVVSSNVAENRSYFYFTELLRRHGIRVPELYGIAKGGSAYLVQDLGSTSLFDVLCDEQYTDRVRGLFADSLTQLARLQWLAGKDADFSKCFAARRFDRQAILADLHYFKYYFADLQNIPYDRAALQHELNALAQRLDGPQAETLMYRDFQSRNIMVQGGQPWFIDFQGAMQGPPQYDVASLLWQAKAQLPAAWKASLYAHYIAAVKDLGLVVEEADFRHRYVQHVLLRLMQVLGAYGLRGLIERKAHFLSSIPLALQNLQIFLADYPDAPPYPVLRGLLEQLAAPEVGERYAPYQQPPAAPLRIGVSSFSYKNGFPPDSSGHGGGYVFDCRGLLNPGRFDAYKKLSGKDAPVKTFLETETKMPTFLEHVKALVALNVEDYLSRGFEHLSVAFGCTGGQHRSVYAAEKVSKWLGETYGVPVSLQHLNQERWVR